MGLTNSANVAIGVRPFLEQRAEYLRLGADRSGFIEFGSPRLHYESLHTEPDASCCLDRRAELRLEALAARDDAPRIAVGWVDFPVSQLGEEPAAEVLDAYGEPAAGFSELFDGAYMDTALGGPRPSPTATSAQSLQSSTQPWTRQ
jgi:hypothetical protein